MGDRRRRPDFFIVGAPKCGTTSLWGYLRGHPQVFVSRPKEPHYFSLDMPGLRQVRDEDAYLELFASAGAEHRALGEASTWYLHSDAAIPAILEACPDARLVAMVRNPVEMVQSLHAQFVYDGWEPEPDFERAWRLQEDRPADSRLRYAESGRLGTLLRRARERVPPEQLKVVVLDDMRRAPLRTYRDVLDFLGLPYMGRGAFEWYNRSKTRRSRALDRFARDTPGPFVAVAEAVKRLLRTDELGILDRVRELNTKVAGRRPISPSLRDELRASFREDVALLSSELGRDLSHWLH